MCLLDIPISSCVKCLFKFFAQFFVIELCFFFTFNYRHSLYVLRINPLSGICVVNIFPQSVAY